MSNSYNRISATP